MKALDRWRQWAKRLAQETYALYQAYRDPRTPWYAKGVALLVVAYALSPIDLIPDFIPVLGYLDDLVVVPLGVALAVRLIPKDVLMEAREKARSGVVADRRAFRRAALVVIALWLAVATVVTWLVVRALLG
jgi:uncharacterized membrane protein YkvA (DUF1232 family)